MTLRDRTLREANIEYIGGAWRFVNHADKIATTGFWNVNGLKKNADIISFGDLEPMRKRYRTLYPQKAAPMTTGEG